QRAPTWRLFDDVDDLNLDPDLDLATLNRDRRAGRHSGVAGSVQIGTRAVVDVFADGQHGVNRHAGGLGELVGASAGIGHGLVARLGLQPGLIGRPEAHAIDVVRAGVHHGAQHRADLGNVADGDGDHVVHDKGDLASGL